MAQTDERSSIPAGARGLATVALLKARFDQGVDQIEVFMPLVMDAASARATQHFTAEAVRDALYSRHALAMPSPSYTPFCDVPPAAADYGGRRACTNARRRSSKPTTSSNARWSFKDSLKLPRFRGGVIAFAATLPAAPSVRS
jgi:hypothetical protein